MALSYPEVCRTIDRLLIVFMKISDFRVTDGEDPGHDVVLDEFNDTYTDYPREKSIVKIYHDIVASYADQVAVIHNSNRITYGQLSSESDCVCATLQSKNVANEEPVAIIMDNSIDMVVAVLGVLKAGCAYVPLNADFPDVRLQHILQETEARIVITHEKFLHKIDAIMAHAKALEYAMVMDESCDEGSAPVSGKHVIKRDDIRMSVDALVETNISASNLAYIAYTSGSMGKPKGVQVEHRSVVRLVKDTNYVQIQVNDVLSQVFPLSFDPSAFEIWGALLHGSLLVIIDKETMLTPSRFHEALKAHRVSICVLVASVFNKIVEFESVFGRDLRMLIIGGEVLSLSHANKARATNRKEMEILNVYGPTENASISTYFPITEIQHGSIPIGKSISNTQCYVLNDHHEPLPLGEVGELCLAGDGLARGYFKDDQLTKDKFIKSPFAQNTRLYKTGDLAKWLPSGDLMFIGRKDNQIKIRGYRVELEEIENHIRAISGIKETIVLDRNSQNNEVVLVAYVTCVNKDAFDADIVKCQLLSIVPEYMVPRVFIPLDEFPLNAHGKVDRKRLPDAKINQRSFCQYVAPSSELQSTLVGMFEESLGIEGIGIYDDFFKIGGHSLKAMQLWLKINERLNVRIGLDELFRNSTVERLAIAIAKHSTKSFEAIPIVSKAPYYRLSHAQKRLWVLDQFEAASTYNIFNLFEFNELLDEKAFRDALEETVSRHEILRTVFVQVDHEPVQLIREVGASKVAATIVDLRCDNIPERINAIANEEAKKSFDLQEGPLLRVTLLRIHDMKYVLMGSMHHIIADGWSMEILKREFMATYDAFRTGQKTPFPPLKIQYKDFSEWQHNQVVQKDEDYWLRKLTPLPENLKLPYEKRVDRTDLFSGAMKFLNLDQSLSDELRRTASTFNTTLSNTILSIYALLLNRITAQDDVIIGIGHANRNHPDLQDAIGYFVNILPIRIEFLEDMSFEQLVAQVSQSCADAFRHSNYPFDLLVEKLSTDRNTIRQSIVKVFYSYLNFYISGIGQASTSAFARNNDEANSSVIGDTAIEQNETKFDLTLYVFDENEDGRLRLGFEYNTQIFHPKTIDNFISLMAALLPAVVKTESQEI